ncbi:tRNA pseudouridine(38-40) synthase TruA [Pontibacillus salipaludis]|uniref:tRNA pseudouridine(38-40) synthase TruA n=1 Tax=Pontibacillus salipaludis TaxID=1697394 RepID=UPI0031E7359A
MVRIACVVSYDGTHFSGFQVQPNGRTVQEEIEKALRKIHKGKEIRLHPSGRTDAGVHARGQVLHFDSDLDNPNMDWRKALQSLMPDDVVIQRAHPVSDDFHSRYSTKKKEYRYRVLNRDIPDVFRRGVTFHYPYKLNIEAIQEACALVEGTHDFTSFCSKKTTMKGDYVRTLYSVRCDVVDDELVFTFIGSGFLYNMVRILIGTFLEIGSGRKHVSDLKEILAAKDRDQAGKTAPPQGLFLWNVDYL